MIKYLSQKDIDNKKYHKEEESDNSVMISEIKYLFNHYSNNSTILSNKQYKLFLIEASLLDDKVLTSQSADTLFYSSSYAKDTITFNIFFDLIIKIVKLIFPDKYKENQSKALSLFLDTYITPLINIYQSSNKNLSPKNDINENELSFNDLNHKLLTSKISSLLTKEIIEENYLLFLKIYQKYFCFENLKISRTQKNHLSQKAFVKVMADFGVSPEYINSTQIEEIYNRIIDNRDYTENVMNDLINVDLCNNDGMWFTLFHFIVGIYLITIFNVMISNYDKYNLNIVYEIFLHNNDSQAFENILKVFYKSSNLKKVIPEEVRKMQIEILKYNNKYIDNDIDAEDNDNSKNYFINKTDINQRDINQSNQNNYNAFGIQKGNSSFKSYLKKYDNDAKENIIDNNKSINKNKNKLVSNYVNRNFKKSKSFDIKNNKKPISNISNLSSKITGDQNHPLEYMEIAPLIVKKYKKQLISVYKYYSELYFETIFSIYMTQNGFINFIKDLNLLAKNNNQINYDNLPAHQRFLLLKKSVNLLNFSAVNLIFSKFSSVPAHSFLKEKGKAGNKRVNFLNFVYILMNLANKIFNPKFNNISFDNKLFSYDSLTNTKFPIKYAHNFIAIYINPLYQQILPIIEEDNFNLNNLKILLENQKLNPLVNIIIPLFIRILKCYNDNKDYVEYSQYFKCLSDFNIFPDFVQHNKMIKIFINFIENFDDIYLLQGNNKIVSDIESCSYGILYIGLGGSDVINTTNVNLEIKLLNFMQKIAQSNNLGKISVLNLRNTLQKDFLNAFYEIQNYLDIHEFPLIQNNY